MIAQSYSIATLDVDKCREFGFDRYLKKPVRKDRIIRLLKELLENRDDRFLNTQSETNLTEKRTEVQKKKEHSLSILIAEDNPVNQKLIKAILGKAGYQVEIANNGKEAVEKVTDSTGVYDLVFMDVQMPEMDGLDATKMIRRKGFNTVPIVAMTAHAMAGDREKCLEAGMDGYITKPIKKEIIFKTIEDLDTKETP
jgi:CheY-like chemotaxis protein